MGKRTGRGKRRARRRVPGVPPPEHKVWPEEYRGKRWKSVYAILFAGRCQLCAYSCALPRSRRMLDKWLGVTRLLLCTNHPASKGELREVLPIDKCRNFQAKSWKRRRTKATRAVPSKFTAPNGEVRRIPLRDGLFATVDASDYAMVSKYKWYAKRHGTTIYATCIRRGQVVYMHRMIMGTGKGMVVDHVDGNGLNNRRCNLRVCTHQQNQANRGSCGGSSCFVGVYWNGRKWQAGLRCRGEYFYLGVFETEVEAAKARDRKAFELHGEFAYLNFPEELGQ